MSIRKTLSALMSDDLELIKKYSNFTDEETEIFDLLSKGYTEDEIALKTSLSISTIKRKIINIKQKGEKCMKLKNEENKIPIWEKLNLTISEAAEYSNIGMNKLDILLKQPNCPFVLYVGTKKLIKRKQFEEYLKKNVEI